MGKFLNQFKSLRTLGKNYFPTIITWNLIIENYSHYFLYWKSKTKYDNKIKLSITMIRYKHKTNQIALSELHQDVLHQFIYLIPDIFWTLFVRILHRILIIQCLIVLPFDNTLLKKPQRISSSNYYISKCLNCFYKYPIAWWFVKNVIRNWNICSTKWLPARGTILRGFKRSRQEVQ